MMVKTITRRPPAAWLLIALLIGHGLLGPFLLLTGDEAIATITTTRRIGGSVRQPPDQYWWVVAYEFTGRDAAPHGGYAHVAGDYTGPRRYQKVEPVLYLGVAPWLNCLRKDTRPGAGTLVMPGMAALIFWLTRQRGWTRVGQARRTRAAEPAPTPLDSADWLRRYPRHGRWYAWSFFALTIPAVLCVIWLETGQIDGEVLASLAFFVAIFLGLALVSRRQTRSAWRGVVRDKLSANRRGGCRLVVEDEKRRRHVLRVSPPLFDYFSIGDAVFKLDGFEWPEKLAPDGRSRVCIACGTLVDAGSTSCERCHAPIPALAAMLDAIPTQARRRTPETA